MFSQNLTLQEAFETAALINEELKNGIQWCILQKSQISNRQIFFIYSLNVENR